MAFPDFRCNVFVHDYVSNDDYDGDDIDYDDNDNHYDNEDDNDKDDDDDDNGNDDYFFWGAYYNDYILSMISNLDISSSVL